jgi:carbon-monoxide dehydrogenase medium subunit
MKPPPFDYFRPSSLSEAIGLLATIENAKVLAGGQSLMPMLNLRYIFPSAVIDINRIPELAGIACSEKAVHIGAMTRQRHIEQDADIKRVAPIFIEALKLVGHRQTRNRGTIGGSLCHLDPASELPTLALLHDATMTAAGPNGTRQIPASEFIAGFMTPGIAPGEIVTSISFAPWSAKHGYAFHEFARRHGDFAIAGAAVLIERGEQGKIERAAIAISGIGSVPQRHREGEACLIGSHGATTALDKAVETCANLEVLADFHGGVDYRLSVARTMLRKSLTLALTRISERA